VRDHESRPAAYLRDTNSLTACTMVGQLLLGHRWTTLDVYHYGKFDVVNKKVEILPGHQEEEGSAVKPLQAYLSMDH
jgi:hypothetical protein